MSDRERLTYKLDQYNVGKNICITAYLPDGEPYSKLTINLPEESHHLLPGEFFAKTYSENAHWYKFALASGNFEDTGRSITKHFDTHSVHYPIWKVTESFIKPLFESTYNSRSDIYDAPQYLFDLYYEIVEKQA
jgi:hypothetical protein